ncbi:hypothetical protein ACFX11_035640 [Malus domestica]
MAQLLQMSWLRISSTVGGRIGSIGGFSTSLEALGSFCGFEAITVKLEWAAKSATTHKQSVVLGIGKGEILGSVKTGGVLGSPP